MDRDTFAAKRREQLLTADESLAPAVSRGLSSHLSGNSNWREPILDAASQVWLENHQAEAPGAAWQKPMAGFRKALDDTLSKTPRPTGRIDNAQVDRITRWLSTYATNAGTMQGSYSAGNRYKVWVDMDDADVRPAHQAVDGQIVPIGSTWNVAGTKLGYPGEPRGPFEVWIECRCVAMPASREGETMSANTFAIGPEDEILDDNPDIVVSNNITAAGDLANPDGTPYTGALVVLVPADTDPVVAASSEPAHVTFVWFGELADLETRDTPEFPQIDLDTLHQEVRNYAADASGPLVVPVRERGTLGDDNADVVFLEPTDSLIAFRDGLLQEEQVGSAFNAVEQFPDWTPHVTLGYPDRPANTEYDSTEVVFDRLSLWLGGEHFDYPLGGDTVTAAGAIDEEIVEEVSQAGTPEDEIDEDLPVDEPEDGEELDDLIPIHGVLAVEGTISGDARGFRPGALTSRKVPLHYRYEYIGSHGGNQTSMAVTVGTLDEVWTHTDGKVRFRGNIDLSREWAAQAVSDIIAGIGFNSIDAASMEQDVSSYFDAEGNMIEPEAPTAETAGKQPETWYSAVKVAGLTQVPVQAFEETYTALGHDFVEDMDEETLAAAAAILEDCGCEDEEAEADEAVTAAAGFAPGTKDGPGWVTHPKATQQIRTYWTKGKGAAKIRWGQGGDFNRCRRQLAKYVQNPDWLAGLCANMHFEALGFWPASHGKGRKGVRRALSASASMHFEARDPITLVASGHAVYPSSAFAQPNEGRAFPMRIDRTTRQITGYAAQWGVCHIGVMGMCQEPPKSKTDYSYFRKGIVETDAGEQNVALITYGIGHAPERGVSAAAATAHYDRTDAVRAYINIGEDAFGIWYSGVLAPWVTDADIDAMLAIRRVSGDWRNWSGRRGDLEMVGLVVVNTDGFQLAADAGLPDMVDGFQTVAIGIGAVPIDEPEDALTASAGVTSEEDANEAFLARAALKVMDMVNQRNRETDLRQRAFAVRQEALRARASERV